MEQYRKIAERLALSRSAVALTGAGISVESGIPDFRSAQGLWSRYDPMEYGTIQSFLGDPAKVWKMLLEMDEIVTRAQPNPAHYALAELERGGYLRGVVTQNVDSLHQRAGSRKVVEFHGHTRTLSCAVCGRRHERQQVCLDQLPPLCRCGGPLRPDLVFFGEGIPVAAHNESLRLMAQCDLLLVIGTSASVAPASHLPVLARERGAFVVEINPQPTELQVADLQLRQRAGRALPAIAEQVDLLDRNK